MPVYAGIGVLANSFPSCGTLVAHLSFCRCAARYELVCFDGANNSDPSRSVVALRFGFAQNSACWLFALPFASQFIRGSWQHNQHAVASRLGRSAHFAWTT